MFGYFIDSELTGLFGHFSFESSSLLGSHVNMAEVKEGSKVEGLAQAVGTAAQGF